MSRFKVGDRVALTVECEDLLEGSVGTVLDSSRAPYVEWDDFTKGHDSTFGDGRQSVYSVPEDRLSLAARPESARILEVLVAAGKVTRADIESAKALVGAAA